MHHNSDFKYDLKLGVIAEKEIASIFTNKKVECKRDFKAMETGNLFIEYESRGKPSGISTTHADYYSFSLSETVHIFIETKELKEICRKFIGTTKDVKGGDSNTSRGILLPIQKIITN